jgi:integrase
MSTDAVTPLRHRMIEDMNARKLCAGTQRGHIHCCERFAVFLNRSPDTATTEDIRRFQLHLAEAGVSICNRNRIMTGVRFLFRVTLRRLDLAAEIYHIREPQKIPLVMSPDETRRLLAVASNLEVRTLLSLGYGCGLRASEVVRLKVKHIDSAQKIIRVEQSKGRKDRNVMLSPETLGLLRKWWKARPSRYDAGASFEIVGNETTREESGFDRASEFFLAIEQLKDLGVSGQSDPRATPAVAMRMASSEDRPESTIRSTPIRGAVSPSNGCPGDQSIINGPSSRRVR